MVPRATLSTFTHPAALTATARLALRSSNFFRPLTCTANRANQNDDPSKDPILSATNKAPSGASGDHEGQFARTDESVQIEYPPDSEMPAQPVVQGRGGMHFKRTLASFSLENRVSMVTGGARGLGLVMAQGLVASGSDLAIVDLNSGSSQAFYMKSMSLEARLPILILAFKRPKQKNKRKSSSINSTKRTPVLITHYADVSNPDSVNTALAEVLAKHNQIDNLVTSAGFTENFEAINYPFDRMQKLWGVNVDGTYLFATGVAKHLMERNAPGSIVMIGSMSGSIVNVPQPQAPYNAAKAAVRHLAASLAVEWAGHDIRVNCISPGYMLTALTRKILDENPQLRDKWTSLIPVGKMGTPEDLMGAVTFLLSDASKYITGADLRVEADIP
ncbi:Glucose/ribitol dehydrogenase [Penicillium cosmopolitanum]|uniref:Glucose/ribitol dehydrogenase n=1 Tax=Penicillium cosmopolitanum TaxID=1131564 RepID=A0A9W9W2V6_9EURO|nr:Glucose/ribitol dehydrogenase [Penicillium cosmopolitanum]KAJ5397542.1 Glucose/ribitol dehydrogenase [Penicillium cosmopolitanum]